MGLSDNYVMGKGDLRKKYVRGEVGSYMVFRPLPEGGGFLNLSIFPSSPPPSPSSPYSWC